MANDELTAGAVSASSQTAQEAHVLDESGLPRLYFSTGSHLYELAYHRHPVGELVNPFVEVQVYALTFLSPLRELPFSGESWFEVIEALADEDERAALLHLSPRYGPNLGHFSRRTPAARPLDVNCVVLIRPSHTTPEIAHLLEQDGYLWYVAALDRQEHEQGAPPPAPSDTAECDQAGAPLFDVFARGRLSGPLVAHVRLSAEKALRLGLELAGLEGGILLRYDKAEDTLHWIKLDQTVTVERAASQPPRGPQALERTYSGGAPCVGRGRRRPGRSFTREPYLLKDKDGVCYDEDQAGGTGDGAVRCKNSSAAAGCTHRHH